MNENEQTKPWSGSLGDKLFQLVMNGSYRVLAIEHSVATANRAIRADLINATFSFSLTLKSKDTVQWEGLPRRIEIEYVTNEKFEDTPSDNSLGGQVMEYVKDSFSGLLVTANSVAAKISLTGADLDSGTYYMKVALIDAKTEQEEYLPKVFEIAYI